MFRLIFKLHQHIWVLNFLKCRCATSYSCLNLQMKQLGQNFILIWWNLILQHLAVIFILYCIITVSCAVSLLTYLLEAIIFCVTCNSDRLRRSRTVEAEIVRTHKWLVILPKPIARKSLFSLLFHNILILGISFCISHSYLQRHPFKRQQLANFVLSYSSCYDYFVVHSVKISQLISLCDL